MTDHTAPDNNVPRKLGSSYILEALIGSGAQGEVWRGRRVDSQETLAFKILRADLVENPHVVDRFIKERSTLLRVRSPYVVAIRDVVIEGATFAIVMDHIDGGDLRDLLRAEGTLPPARLAAMGLRISQGLRAVHDAGVVHRDVKPANILLSGAPNGVPDDRSAPGAQEGSAVPVSASAQTILSSHSGQSAITVPDNAVVPRVADFGVARICDAFATAHVTGAIGTPLYMAPEILSTEAPTPAADIYSLGVMLYEMASGITPFVGEPARLLAQHARYEPGRPEGVPDALWDLIASMLAKQPGARPPIQYIIQRLETLQTALAGLPAAVRLPAPPVSTISTVPYDWDRPSTNGPASQEGAQRASYGQLGETLVGHTTTTAAEGPQPGGVQAPAPYSPQATGSPGAVSITPTADTPYSAYQGGAYQGGAARSSYQTGTGPASPGAGGPAVPAALAAPQTGDGAQSQAVPGEPTTRRRRRLWIPALAAVLVIAMVAAGVLWWRSRSGSEFDAVWAAALPSGDSVREDHRVSGAIDLVVSPSGEMFAAEADGKWSLYDLTSRDRAPVWSGECDEARFWNGQTMLCTQSSGDSALVGKDGTTRDTPGPADLTWVGATADLAIIAQSDNGGGGNLMAIDSQGKTVWSVPGEYDEGVVANGFIVTHNGGSDQVQVLSAATGSVLTSVGSISSPSFNKERPGSLIERTQRPGGFDISTGPEAFSRVSDDSVTVYKADGTQVKTFQGDYSELPLLATSAPLDADALVEAYQVSIDNSSSIYAFGPGKRSEVKIDTSACTATADGTTLEIPAPPPGSECSIKPLGVLSDDTLLVQVGKPSSSSDKSDVVLAYSLETGKPTWQVQGTIAYVVKPIEGESGGRPLLGRTGTITGDAVVVSVTKK